MFKQEKGIIDTKNDIGVPLTVIAKNVIVTGDLVSEGDVVIDGSLKGSLKTKGSIKIGDGAVIEADIEAKTGTIAGKIFGKIVVHEFLELQPTAEINGDITVGQIAIAQGANINGAITMVRKQPENSIEHEPAIMRKNR